LDARPDLAVIDVSFISLKLVIKPVLSVLAPGGRVLALVKPQFEVGRGEVGKKGVVRDPKKHARVLSELSEHFQALGCAVSEPVASPILGPEGNKEFFLLLGAPAP